MLIMGSQMTGISIFSFLVSKMPIWAFASIYTALGIIIILIGVKWFERLGNLFAMAKLAAIFMFILLAILGITGVLKRGNPEIYWPDSLNGFLPGG